ncbi:MAG: hypothetical protein HPY76_05770, partial [Anaerolineae bacterium]|nr:hypothetical protein [Anaerolineae bacterium]
MAIETGRSDQLAHNSWHLMALLVVVVFIASQVSTLSSFGLAWDEGLGNLFFGERYTYYWQTFQHKYLDFRTELAYHDTTAINTYLSPFRDYPYEFPGFWDTLSAGCMRLLAYRWGWLDAVDAFHLPTILLTGQFLWLFFSWVQRRLGGLTALLALVMLTSFPRLWADAHFNIKDVPEMAFFGLAVMAYAKWYKDPSW